MVLMVSNFHNLDLIVKKDFFAALLHIEETKNGKNKTKLTLEELINRGYQKISWLAVF